MEEMQGVMSLPQSGAARAPVDPQQEQVFQKLRQEVPPKQFSDELLGAASQADPQAVKAFVDELRSLEVPMDTLVMLNEMVDAILANPQDYERIRRQYMAQGIPEDVLPERFDAMFFAALNMALDQLTVQQAAPIGMAGGGIADLAQYGRHGDTMLAHITPEEAALLKSRGGSGTINPVTGLPEFFIGKLFKSIGNAVKKFAQSTIGRIVLPIALGFFLGPAAASIFQVTSTAAVAAVSGFVGGAGSALLRGENLGDALKAGAIGGVTAGAGAGIMGGADAFAAGSYTGPTTVGGQFDRFTEGVKTLVSPAQAAPPAVPTPEQYAQAVPSTVTGAAGIDSIPGMEGPPQAFPVQQNVVSPGVDTSGAAPVPKGQPIGGPVRVSQPIDAQFQYANRAGTLSASMDFPPAPVSTPDVSPLRQPFYSANAANSMYADPGSAAFEATAKPLSDLNIPPPGNMPPPPPSGTEPGFMDKAKGLYDEYLNPTTRGQVTEQGIMAQRPKAESIIRAARPDLASAAPGTTEARLFNELVGKKAIELATPGMLSTYGPLAAAGVVGMAALGGFESKPAAAPDLVAMDPFNPAYAKPLQFGGIYAPRGYYAPRPNPTYEPPPVRKAADGGIMALEMGGTTYPRKQGHIKGPGTGTSDSIPALLSDGEFVFTAKAVRNLGQGSRRKGAKRLYAMMKMLEERKV